jgi:hypothetical protein
MTIKPSGILLNDRVAVVTAGGWYHHLETGGYKFGPG